jgi:hypothetical protein
MLKADLLLGGVRIDGCALRGEYKQEIHRVFEWDDKWHAEERYPSEFRLADGSILEIRKDSQSPYLITVEDKSLCLKKNDTVISEIEYVRAPSFYNKSTRDGTPMWRVAEFSAAQSKVGASYGPHCILYDGNEQCKFCNMVPARAAYKQMIDYPTPQQHGEAIAAAYAEGAKKLCLTGGILSDRMEFGLCARIGNAIREYSGKDRIPGHVNVAAPVELKEIDRMYDAGFESICMSLEVWEKNLFAGICPGKARLVGREKWLDALEYAVRVFGSGKVLSAFVAGLESQESLLEGVEYLASKDVLPVPIPWIPCPGSKLEGHRTPSTAWHLSLGDKIHELWKRYGFDAEITRTGRKYL